MSRFVAIVVVALWFATGSICHALTVSDLNPTATYRTGSITFSGNRAFSAGELRSEIEIKRRPWYKPWKSLPRFEPEQFSADLERLQLFYQIHGYYRAKLSYDLTVHDKVVTVHIKIHEGRPAIVRQVNVKIDDYSPPPDQPPVSLLSLKTGDVFEQAAYQKGEQELRVFFENAGYARATSTRRAEVDVASNTVRIWYAVHPGSQALFGKTTITGTDSVAPHIVRRALAYKEGEQFEQDKLDKSRDNLLGLNLFSAVRFIPELDAPGSKIPIDLALRARPPHSIRIGGGYNTVDDLGGQFQWTDYNWLGDGRQFSVMLRYASINSAANVSVLQPFLFGIRGLEGAIKGGLIQDDEQTFLLNAVNVKPYILYHFSEHLVGSLGYQFQYGRINNVNASVVTALGGITRKGIVSGPTLGLTWNTTNSPLNPTRGGIVLFKAEQSSGFWGGDYSFYRTTLEGRKYNEIPFNTILATRLKIGFADSLGPAIDYPIFARFFPGGQGSVRGYGRWRVGPLSSSGDPLGGLSLIEGSIELRHHIWQKLGGAVFMDFGQTSLHTYDLPVDNLRFGFGPGLMYETPVGPLSIYLGFPSQTPRGDQSWQVYFAVGQYF